jgi:myo-inositol-1(or 4)-monophosphatase
VSPPPGSARGPAPGPSPVETPTPLELLELAVAAARAAGAVLVEGLGRDKQVQLKSERASIVTWADVTAQAEVIRVIAGRYPDHAILAEEGLGDAADGRLTWLVDPLDGTSNYAHGIPFACTSVAVRDQDGLAAGAIYEPFRGELFTAARGAGAWLGEERLSVSTAAVPARALVCTGIQTDDPEQLAGFGRRIVALNLQCRGVRCLGSPALCLAYVAAGRIDAFLERDATYAWDVGAGALMIREAGGTVEDLDGGPLNLGPGVANVLATNGHLHDELAAIIRAVDGAG